MSLYGHQFALLDDRNATLPRSSALAGGESSIPCWHKQILFCHSFNCDNLAVVTILNSRTFKDSLIMHLLRNLLMSAAYFGFTFCAQHVPGVENKIADALSRFQWQSFRHHAPLAKAHPVNIPQSLWVELLPPVASSINKKNLLFCTK